MSNPSSPTCQICGYPLREGAAHCPNCGEFLGKVDETLKTPTGSDQPEEPLKGETVASPQHSYEIPETVPAGSDAAATQRFAEDQFFCPHCGESHKVGVNFCPNTGMSLAVAATQVASSPTKVAETEMASQTTEVAPTVAPSPLMPCPYCGNGVAPGTQICQFCGSPISHQLPPDKDTNRFWWIIIMILLFIGCIGVTALTYYCYQEGEKPLECIQGIVFNDDPSATEETITPPGSKTPIITPSNTQIDPHISPPPDILASDTQTIPPSSTDSLEPSPTITNPPSHDLTQYNLAFSSDRDGRYQIFVTNSDNPGEWKALHHPQGAFRAWHPSFCGDKVAAEIHFNSNQTQWIHLLDQDSEVPLSGNAAPPRDKELGTPDCAHDSGYLAYSWRGGGWAVNVVDLDADEVVREYVLSSGHYALYPSLPDSYRIYFVEQDLSIEPARFRILEANLNSTSYRPVTPSVADGRPIQQSLYPAANKQLTKIAFTCLLSGQNQYNLCVANMGSTSAEILVQNLGLRRENDLAPGAPAWSEDGEWIYFSKSQNGQYDIFRVNITNRSVENLTNAPNSNELMPAIRWNP